MHHFHEKDHTDVYVYFVKMKPFTTHINILIYVGELIKIPLLYFLVPVKIQPYGVA